MVLMLASHKLFKYIKVFFLLHLLIPLYVFVFSASFGVACGNCCAPAWSICSALLRTTPWLAPANQHALSWCHKAVMTSLRKGWPLILPPLFSSLPAMTQTLWTLATNIEIHQRQRLFKSDPFDHTTKTLKYRKNKADPFVFAIHQTFRFDVRQFQI